MNVNVHSNIYRDPLTLITKTMAHGIRNSNESKLLRQLDFLPAGQHEVALALYNELINETANLRRQLKALRSGTSVSSTAAADNNDSDSSTVDGDGTSGVAKSDTPTLLDLEDRRSGTFKNWQVKRRFGRLRRCMIVFLVPIQMKSLFL